MRYSQAKAGRVFVIRLEDGEVVHEAIESLARREGIRAAALVILEGQIPVAAWWSAPKREGQGPWYP